MVIRCQIVLPKTSVSEVRSVLDDQRISYTYWGDVIFANLDVPTKELEDSGDVIDPVSEKEDRWFFQIPGDELNGPYDSEDQARTRFINYISWVGEFVDNS